jgi:hypothetical protein
MGRTSYFEPGSWNFWCQQCGKRLKATEGRRRWDGLWVGPECFEIRHPQDFVRGIPDRQSVPWSTGDPPWVYVGNAVVPPSRPLGSSMLNEFIVG